jgi:hypothetical protein
MKDYAAMSDVVLRVDCVATDSALLATTSPAHVMKPCATWT